ncbi:hypothetical protein N5D45_05595 [Stenotrophomonas sp. GD03819]|uniref:hypothetical protein n=1 Tax=Stenotrophomonas sp. GD03819 TaxID=2975384 RepID=UPI002447465C|nr:hypothetical protein [Stenotrophomonas sp. GD03819]MDH1791288.1 hypothetical protein [Stenotrophomonas sp. GD03819]
MLLPREVMNRALETARVGAAVSGWLAIGSHQAHSSRGRMPATPPMECGMSIIDGVSQCWLLSRSCVIDWDAWAAIATAAATGLALALALKETQARRRKAKHDALRSKIALYPHVHEAQAAVTSLGSVIRPDTQLILPNIEYEIQRVTAAMEAIKGTGHQLEDDDALLLANATSLAEYVVRQSKRLVNGDAAAHSDATLRDEWAKDARRATQLFLNLASDYKRVSKA